MDEGRGQKRGVLVTGASGFVGRSLLSRSWAGRWVRGAYRSAPPADIGHLCGIVGDIGANTSWEPLLEDVDVVVHCAAHVHQLQPQAPSAGQTDLYRSVNVDGTIQLARQAVKAGCRRLVYISSVKASAEASRPGSPLIEGDPPVPVDPYGCSKLAAEEALWSLARSSSLEVVVIRPPLIYGAGVGANFSRMMRWVHAGIPLPLGSIDNRRSLVAVDNLCSFVQLCADHSAAAGECFFVSDMEDVSTPELLRRMAAALGVPSRLLRFPPAWLSGAARVLGQTEVAQRLLGSLQVDCAKARRLTGWHPPVSLDEGLARAARHFLAARHGRH